MIENLTRAQYETLLRQDLTTFTARCFCELDPQTRLAIELVPRGHFRQADGGARRPDQSTIINLPAAAS